MFAALQIWRIWLRISRRSLASRLDSGSSRSRTTGSMTRARARATRCCWPPENCIVGFVGGAVGHVDAFEERRRRAAGFAPPGTLRTLESSKGDVLRHGHVGPEGRSSGRPCRSCGTWLAGRRGDVLIGRSGWCRLVGSVKPAIMRRRVVLPQPLGPRRKKRDPAGMSRLMPAHGGGFAEGLGAGRRCGWGAWDGDFSRKRRILVGRTRKATVLAGGAIKLNRLVKRAKDTTQRPIILLGRTLITHPAKTVACASG